MGRRAVWGLTEREKLIDLVMKNALLWKIDHPDNIKKTKLTRYLDPANIGTRFINGLIGIS